MRGVATNVYSRKTSEKPERCGLRTLRIKGSGVVFMHGEGISTPRVRPKRRQPLIRCANMTSIFRFPFTFLFLYIFFYLFAVDEGVSLAPTYSSITIRKSDLRSSLVKKAFWLLFFFPFLHDMFLLNERSFKALDH